ncbi:TMEM175 family protein [Streptomyces sp. NRRL F-5126]|uniref:TMEM175 family protein n=1 Tax=Streptomyces sp. NRRL F-5126 TaxID=1463857 RepID=UPI001F3C6E45|nr:TMEM175 family protein [Streptomyces sp. NRRL F-5126]
MSGFGDDPGQLPPGPLGPTGLPAPLPVGRQSVWSAERLLLFTDAVTAISITLLILPLVDLVPEAVSAHETGSEVITDHWSQIWSFLLSFLVVARFWMAHHRTFSMVGALNGRLVVWNMIWLLSIVVLPFPTEIVGSFGHDRFTAALYYANILVSLVCQAAMLALIKAHPETLTVDDESTRALIASGYTEGCRNIVALVVAFALALAVPLLDYYSLLLLAVFPRVDILRKRKGAG